MSNLTIKKVLSLLQIPLRIIFKEKKIDKPFKHHSTTLSLIFNKTPNSDG